MKTSKEQLIKISLNGTDLLVKDLIFDKAKSHESVFYHDCYVVFEDGTVQRYDAGDIAIY